jgi:TetR/AcrR family transcriptional regulator, transcriptional repressor for nem operon
MAAVSVYLSSGRVKGRTMAIATRDTRERIMEAARLTVQDRGYNGLSFRELAKDVGIKSASIYYYFPTKGELGSALGARDTFDFLEYLDGLLAEGLDQKACIQKYTEVFGQTVRNDNRMCLGGMMAAEFNELPPEVRIEVVKFGEANVDWLVKVLSLGKPGEGDALRGQALAIYAAVQGAQLIARSRGDAKVYDAIIETYRESALLP